jgi:hypothetical protein
VDDPGQEAAHRVCSAGLYTKTGALVLTDGGNSLTVSVTGADLPSSRRASPARA